MRKPWLEMWAGNYQQSQLASQLSNTKRGPEPWLPFRAVYILRVVSWAVKSAFRFSVGTCEGTTGEG